MIKVRSTKSRKIHSNRFDFDYEKVLEKTFKKKSIKCSLFILKCILLNYNVEVKDDKTNVTHLYLNSTK